MRIRPLLLVFVLLIAVQVIVGPPTLRFVEQAATVHASGTSAGQENSAPAVPLTPGQQLAEMLNQERIKAGLAPLAWDDGLAEVALQHTTLMAQRGELAHELAGEPPLRERLGATNLRLDRSGENVGSHTSIERAHEGFMRSPAHRENILGPQYNAVGIAVVRAGEKLYITQDFAHRLPEISDAQAFDIVSNSIASLRRSAGVPAIRQLEDAHVSDLAAAMAHQDKLNHNAGLTLPGARYAVAYTVSEPDKLPPEVTEMAVQRDIDRYAVGICFARSRTYPSGVYWVLMVFFSPASA